MQEPTIALARTDREAEIAEAQRAADEAAEARRKADKAATLKALVDLEAEVVATRAALKERRREAKAWLEEVEAWAESEALEPAGVHSLIERGRNLKRPLEVNVQSATPTPFGAMTPFTVLDALQSLAREAA